MRTLIKSFGYAFSGIAYTFKTQKNFRIHSLATIIVSYLGWYFQLSAAEWAFLLLAIGLVLVAEVTNTAIELLVDHVSPDYDISAGRIKDIAAGAVLVAAIIAVIIAAIIFIPKFS